jgi:hypothetical protein
VAREGLDCAVGVAVGSLGLGEEFTLNVVEKFDAKYGEKVETNVSKFTEKGIAIAFERNDNHDYKDRNDDIGHIESHALDTSSAANLKSSGGPRMKLFSKGKYNKKK